MSWSDEYREQLLAEPYPEDWETYLVRNVAHFHLLSEAERSRLRNNTRVLVAEKNWEGCGGLQITEEIKVTIAAQAGLLLLGLEHDYFRRVLSILVYPSAFLVPAGGWMDDYEGAIAFAGQAVYRGPVILSWDSVLADGQDPSVGNNLVIHEFAHQLDFLDDFTPGTPNLLDPDKAARWHKAMTAEYLRLVRKVRKKRATFLGDYAALNKNEFFAVSSERFFTKPALLQHYHQSLYEVLAEFYGVGPIEWFARRSTA